MMQVRDMSDFDLHGVLFVHYPAALSEDVCRERLEMEIALVAVEDEAEDDEICISPFWVFRVLFERAKNQVLKMSRQDLHVAANRILAKRRKQSSFEKNKERKP